MNPHIRELLNEATVGLEPDISPQRTVTLNEMEKFAELIIKETLQLARAGIEFGPSMDEAVENYFGVKL